MEQADLQNCSRDCSRAGEIAAYLDGEFVAVNAISFEQHLTECAECAEKLNAQKRLLRALDVAFESEKSFKLPVNFVKSIVARAESDVSGLRSKDEQRRALLITGGLLLFGVLVAIAGRQSGFLPPVVDSFLTQVFVVGKVLVDFCRDFAVGLSVVVRVAGRQLINDSPLAIFSLAVLLVASFGALSRLLFKFHRAQQSG